MAKSKIAEHDEQEYRKHNVVRREVRRDGSLVREPVSHSMQCACDSCRAHRRRNSITGVADPNRSI
jgi:hypothetical protein